MNRCLVIAFLIAGCTISSSTKGYCQAGVSPVSYSPFMVGSADNPQTVTYASNVSYTIKSTDKDTYVNDTTKVQFQDVDLTQDIKIVTIRSMSSYILNKRGIDTNGTASYDLTGPCIDPGSTTITASDDFSLINVRSDGDLLKDNPVSVSQLVTIKPGVQSTTPVNSNNPPGSTPPPGTPPSSP